MNNIKNITISILLFLIVLMSCLIYNQNKQILIMKSEIQSNREIINTELHMIDSIYDNNYRLWDDRINIILQHFENQGYLIKNE